MGISDEQRIINYLRTCPHQKATFAQIAVALSAGARRQWTPDAVEAKIRRFDAEGLAALHVVRGGVQYFGGERLRASAIYDAVRDGLARWTDDHGLRLAREPLVLGPVGRVEAGGEWRYPDLVFHSRRRAGASPAEYTHSVEVEHVDGFDVRSIYQAHEQGRGADMAWVMFHNPRRGIIPARVIGLAEELGVGIVGMPRPTQPTRWLRHLGARPRRPLPELRADFDARIKRYYDRPGG
jgi:hypothetical protein